MQTPTQLGAAGLQGWRAKAADAVAEPLAQRSPLAEDQVRAAIGGLFLLDWRLGLVALLVLPPGMLITRWFQRSSHAAFSDVRTRIAAVTAQLAESVAGMAVVQAFNRERAFQAEFDDLNAQKREADTAAQRVSSVFFPSIELLGVIATVSVLALGAVLHDNGSLTIGTLIAGRHLRTTPPLVVALASTGVSTLAVLPVGIVQAPAGMWHVETVAAVLVLGFVGTALAYVLFFALTPARYRKRQCRKWPGALLITAWWLATVEVLPNILGLLGGYNLTYGSLAGVMIALIFFFVIGLGVVTGAELNAALAESGAIALKGEVYTGPYTDELEVEEPQPGEDVKVELETGGPQL